MELIQNDLLVLDKSTGNNNNVNKVNYHQRGAHISRGNQNQQHGSYQSSSRNSSRQRSASKQNIRCFSCGDWGHIAKQCTVQQQQPGSFYQNKDKFSYTSRYNNYRNKHGYNNRNNSNNYRSNCSSNYKNNSNSNYRNSNGNNYRNSRGNDYKNNSGNDHRNSSNSNTIYPSTNNNPDNIIFRNLSMHDDNGSSFNANNMTC